MPKVNFQIRKQYPSSVTRREAWENLANAIILQAVEDYCYLKVYDCVQYGNGAETKIELLQFFRSDWFTNLCGYLDPETVIAQTEKIVERWRKENER